MIISSHHSRCPMLTRRIDVLIKALVTCLAIGATIFFIHYFVSLNPVFLFAVAVHYLFESFQAGPFRRILWLFSYERLRVIIMHGSLTELMSHLSSFMHYYVSWRRPLHPVFILSNAKLSCSSFFEQSVSKALPQNIFVS